MPIKPTTPTSAGLAQSFDSSGLVALAQHQRDKRDKRLAKMAVEYDTKGIFKRDIPYVQRQVKDFEQFTLANQEKLTDPSNNMEVYQEWQDKKNAIKNTITYSVSAKEAHASGMKMLGTDRYLNEENKSLLDSYAQIPTDEQYEDLSAFDDLQQGMIRNTDIDYKKYTDLASKLVEDLPPEMAGQVAEGKIILKEGKALDQEQLKEALRPMFMQERSLEAGDLRYEYGEGEDGLNAFAKAVAEGVSTSPEYAITTVKTEAEKKAATAAERKAEFAVIPQATSGYSGIETAYDPETSQPYKYTDEFNKQQDAVRVHGLATTGGEGSVLNFHPNLRLVKNVTEAQDLTTGKMLDPGEGKKYKYQIPLERANYMVANERIEIQYIDEKGKKVKSTFEKGEALPDLQKMKDSGAITKDRFNTYVGKSSTQDGYVVYASNEKIDYFDLAKGEDVKNILEGKGGRYLMVPAHTISRDVDRELQYAYGKTQEDYRPEQAAADTNNYMEDL